MFLPHFDVFFDLLMNRGMTSWNLFVLYNKEVKANINVIFVFGSLQEIIDDDKSKVHRI